MFLPLFFESLINLSITGLNFHIKSRFHYHDVELNFVRRFYLNDMAVSIAAEKKSVLNY